MKRVATYKERRGMEDLMLQHSSAGTDDNDRTWDSGWDFERVARSVAPDLYAHHAKAVADMLELVFEKKKPRTHSELELLVLELLERLEKAEMKIEQLQRIAKVA